MSSFFARIAAIALIVAAFLVAVACQNPTGPSNNDSNGGGSPGGDWSGDGPFGYFAGFRNDGIKEPVYWTATTEDGGATTISEPIGLCSAVASACHGVVGEATDIFVDAEDVVHVVGWFSMDGVGEVAAYWADDGQDIVLHVLDDASIGMATGIVVGPSDTVYISGYYTDTPFEIATYWTVNNGSIGDPHDLHTSDSSSATGIAVDGSGVVYASGWYNDGTRVVAAYWRDSGGSVTRFDLYPGTLSQANAIVVDGATVHIAGYHLDGLILAAEWTDDNSGLQPLNTTQVSDAKAVTRFNGETYTAGDYLDTLDTEFVRRAVYWRETTQTELADGASTEHTFADGIAIVDGDVYVAGRVGDGSAARAVYWKNGNVVELSTDAQSQATALFIRR